MSLSTAKIVEVLFENAFTTHEHQVQLLDQVAQFTPDAAALQNASFRSGTRDGAVGTNQIWRPIQQNRPIVEGFDLTTHAATEANTAIIQEFYPASLEVPKNDLIVQPVEDMRDMQFWIDAGVESGKKQASFLNQRLAQLVRDTGSIYYESNASGYDFVSEAYTVLSERQTGMMNGAFFHMNDRDYNILGADLAGRGTLSGRPETAYATGEIGKQIAGFDSVFRSNFLSTLSGGATPDTTVTGAQSFKPEGSDVSGSSAVNIDYRFAELPVAASSAYNIGDKIHILNGSTPLNALSLTDKGDTGQPMTFTVTAKPTGTSIQVMPKPIAADDVTLSPPEAAVANVDTTITNGAILRRLNAYTTGARRTNIFWCKDSLEVMKGEAPLGLLKSLGGMEVISKTMSNGQTMYMVYDGDILKLDFTCRLFTWWGLTNKNPSANGVVTRLP